MTVVELVVGMTVLFLAVGGTLGVISSFVTLEESSRQTTLAYLEAQRTIERLQAQPFEEVFARFNASAGDDPAGDAPGDTFDVPGLSAQDGDADGSVGAILFPVDPNDATALREDLQDDALGMPRDLNADGAIGNDDHAGDYAILPVRVRVEWRGRSGNRFVELHTVLREE